MQTILGWNLRGKKRSFSPEMFFFFKSVMILDSFLGHLGNLVPSPCLKVSVLSHRFLLMFPSKQYLKVVNIF